MGLNKENISVQSLLVSAGRPGDVGAPLNAPMVPASNFILGGSREYARDDGTATWEALEEIVGALEGGRAVAFASGMAAIAAVFDQLKADSKVVLPEDCYQGVTALAEAGARKGFWQVERIAVDNTAAWVQALTDADLGWLESPSNPLLVVGDMLALCGAKRKPGSILAVDNTFATPLNQKPLELGADVSVHSATKSIGGHSDLLAGIAISKHPDLSQALHETRTLAGATPGALEAYLAVRGLRTLGVRLERAQQNAMELATRLEAHPKVGLTRYPGLKSHPTHGIAAEQLAGFGTVVSFDVNNGADAADAVCERVSLIRHATSLGAVESTMERRAKNPGQEHLPQSMLRLSVGIEDVDDLWADLDQALP